jgi:hypothetical protein
LSLLGLNCQNKKKKKEKKKKRQAVIWDSNPAKTNVSYMKQVVRTKFMELATKDGIQTFCLLPELVSYI